MSQFLSTLLLAASAASGVHGLRANGAPPAIAISERCDTIPRESVQMGQFDAARFDSVTAFALRSLLDSAVERRIPTGPLVSRALEGAARRASSARILLVVREHAAAMSDARDVLGGSSTVADLDAGADALKAGITRDALRSVRSTRPSTSVAMPLTVLTDLIRQRGLPPASALDAVMTIARAPSSDEALQGLQVTVAKNAIRGPGMALEALKRYVRITVPGLVSPSAPATGERKPIRPPDS